MATESPQTITVGGTDLTLKVERKRVKNVNVRLRGSTLYVSAPHGISGEALAPVVMELARKLLGRAHAQRVNEEKDALAIARKVAARFPESPEVDRALFVTTQRSSWGSYSPRTNTVRLNAALRRMPRWVLEAVVAHELAHFFHRDHSPAFRETLRRVCPQTDKAEAFLAGVSWLGRNWGELPEAERRLLGSSGEHGAEET